MTNYCALPSGTLKNTQDLGSIPWGMSLHQDLVLNLTQEIPQ
uniref:Uncharacterized protein n=1 Tax=Anguilla anguilla TaxID=7936 RepID=A0A0E9PAK9_ANGAN